MGTQRQQFNAEEFLNKNGLALSGVNPDGTLSVKTQDGKESNFNLPGYLKSNNMSPADLDIKYNSPETAFSDNALDFGTQVGFIKAGTPKQQLGYLQRTYGADNVSRVGDEFKVKDKDGVWKNAGSKWYNDLVAGSPGIAAAIGGTAAGATLGSSLGPAGAVVGGILGGATAGMIEKYGEQKAAEMMGIRTEQDVKDTASELGRDFANNVIWDTATLGAGKALKAMNPFNKVKIANVLGGLVNGTTTSDWLVAMRSAGDAKVVRAVAEKDAEAFAKGGLQAELMPSSKAMASTFGKSIETARKVAERNYANGLKKLDAVGALDYSHLPINSVRNGLIEDLSAAGLVKMEGNTPVFKTAKELGSSVISVVDQEAQNKLRHVFNAVEGIYSKQGAGVPGATALPNKPELGDLLNLKRMINAVQADLGHFTSRASVSDAPGRILSKSSAATDRLFKIGASHVTTKLDGKTAADVFNEMQSNYSNFRSGYDFLAKTAKDFDINNLGNSLELSKMVGKLDSEGGAKILQAYNTMADSIGSTAMKDKLIRLQQLNAGKSLASQFGGSGVVGAVRSAAGITALPVSSAVTKGTEFVAPIMQKLSPIAKASNFVRKLSPDQKYQMLSNNKMLSEFLQSITGADMLRQQTEQDLMSQVQPQ